MGPGLDSRVDPRFGRCPYFVTVDSETMQFELLPNDAAKATGGAGIQAAKTIAGKCEVLVTGNIGPNALEVLSAVGVKVATGIFGTVREAVEQYKRGELKETNLPTVGGHHGMPGGKGSSGKPGTMGRGREGGGN